MIGVTRVKYAIIGFAALTLSAAHAADPLADAQTGKLQCYKPDSSRKTCVALAGYVTQSDGTIINNAEILISPQPPLVMRTSSAVTVKGGAICGIMRQTDIEHADFLANGSKLADEQAAAIRSQLIPMLQGQFGKEVCTTAVPDGDRLRANVTVDGSPNPVLTQDVVWVKPDEGYKVAP